MGRAERNYCRTSSASAWMRASNDHIYVASRAACIRPCSMRTRRGADLSRRCSPGNTIADQPRRISCRRRVRWHAQPVSITAQPGGWTPAAMRCLNDQSGCQRAAASGFGRACVSLKQRHGGTSPCMESLTQGVGRERRRFHGGCPASLQGVGCCWPAGGLTWRKAWYDVCTDGVSA